MPLDIKLTITWSSEGSGTSSSAISNRELGFVCMAAIVFKIPRFRKRLYEQIAMVFPAVDQI